MAILVTGAAGFIGAAVSKTLLDRSDAVVGLDSLNDYYDVVLKQARLGRLKVLPTFTFEHGNIADRGVLPALFKKHQIHAVVHLAAQAGVRYSIENPAAYIDANLVGFGNMLEAVRQADGIPLVYASSSSVYGANDKLPFSECDRVDQPMSLYAATKRSNELMAYAYAHLYRLPLVGLRFFTVYGPWGRPDMALFKFTKAILNDEPITLYNRGNMVRDFTYIDDAVRAVVGILDASLGQTLFSGASTTPWRGYNIGNHKKVPLMDYVRVLEQCLGRKAAVDLLPMQDGDVPETDADVSKLVRDFGAPMSIDVQEGIARFVSWYRDYYKV